MIRGQVEAVSVLRHDADLRHWRRRRRRDENLLLLLTLKGLHIMLLLTNDLLLHGLNVLLLRLLRDEYSGRGRRQSGRGDIDGRQDASEIHRRIRSVHFSSSFDKSV